jgi:peptidyl-prolyl cis-trans isomerase D
MLQSIRDRTQNWIAWVVVGMIIVPFALWGIHEYIGDTDKGTAAVVNGADISLMQYEQMSRDQLQQLRASMSGKNADLSKFEAKIKENVLNQLIQHELLFQTAAHLRMQISNDILSKYIQSIPAFHDQGKFSPARYEQLLKAQGMSPAHFEQELRRDLLLAQMETGITESAVVTPQEKQRFTQWDKQQRLISYIPISAQALAEKFNITDEEVQTHYQTNQKDYFSAEKVSVNYVMLTPENIEKTVNDPIEESTIQQYYQDHLKKFVVPPEWHAAHILVNKDEENAETKAQGIAKRAQAGEDFGALAKEFSKDPGSAEKGGDLGFFKAGMMVKPFEEAVKQLQPNQISEVVKSDFGFHIIKLFETKPEQTKTLDMVKEEIIAAIRKEQAETKFYAQAEQLGNLAYEKPDSLEPIVQALGLPLQTTELFSRDAKLDAPLNNPKFMQAAFSEAVIKDNQNSEIVDVGKHKSVVLHLKAHEAPQLQPLDSAKEKIVTRLKKEKAQKAAEALSKQILEALKNPEELQKLLAQENLQWSPKTWIERNDSKLKQPALVQAAFKMGSPTQGQALFQQLALNNDDYGVVALLEVKDGSEESKTPLKAGNSEFKWLAKGLKDRAEVKINSVVTKQQQNSSNL